MNALKDVAKWFIAEQRSLVEEYCDFLLDFQIERNYEDYYFCNIKLLAHYMYFLNINFKIVPCVCFFKKDERYYHNNECVLELIPVIVFTYKNKQVLVDATIDLFFIPNKKYIFTLSEIKFGKFQNEETKKRVVTEFIKLSKVIKELDMNAYSTYRLEAIEYLKQKTNFDPYLSDS